MQIKYDTSADALYVKIKKGVVKKTINRDDTLLIDLDNGGRVLGFEVLNYSKTVPKLDRSFVSIGHKRLALPIA